MGSSRMLDSDALISMVCDPSRHAGERRTSGTTMAKPNTVLIKLLSTAGTGFFYVKKKNPRKATEKLEFRKYDPVIRKHVEYVEGKIK